MAKIRVYSRYFTHFFKDVNRLLFAKNHDRLQSLWQSQSNHHPPNIRSQRANDAAISSIPMKSCVRSVRYNKTIILTLFSMNNNPPALDTDGPLSADFYTVQDSWKWRSRIYENDYQRVFGTIQTSYTTEPSDTNPQRCRFFNEQGKQISLDEFKKKYEESCDSFIVIMKPDTGEFIFKPSLWKIIEAAKKVGWKIQSTLQIWKKVA